MKKRFSSSFKKSKLNKIFHKIKKKKKKHNIIKNHRLYLFHSIFQLHREIGCTGESANKRLKGLRLHVLGRCALQNAATVSMDIGYGR